MMRLNRYRKEVAGLMRLSTRISSIDGSSVNRSSSIGIGHIK